MKKLLLASVLCLILTFTSCSGNNNNNETQVTEWRPSSTAKVEKPQAGGIEIKEEKININSDKNKATKATTKPTEATEETTEATEPIPTQGVLNPNGHVPVTTVMGSLSKSDLDFVYGKNTLKLNDNIENIFTAIGEDNVSQELSASKMEYIYPDFTLHTYIDQEDNEKLEKIIITKEAIATPKGVKIGDYASALVRIYGNPTKQEKNTKQYEKDGKQLIFKYADNHITEISYRYIVK